MLLILKHIFSKYIKYSKPKKGNQNLNSDLHLNIKTARKKGGERLNRHIKINPRN